MAARETITVTVTVRLGPTFAELTEHFEVQGKSLDDALAVLEGFHATAERIRDEQAGLKK